MANAPAFTQDSVYEGPIFDADTHLFETADAFVKYLPAEVRERHGIHFKHADDGQYALHVGNRKVEITADHYHEDQLVPRSRQAS
jgi:hypothetical protein